MLFINHLLPGKKKGDQKAEQALQDRFGILQAAQQLNL